MKGTPAFPCPASETTYPDKSHKFFAAQTGMTDHDVFMLVALHGILSSGQEGVFHYTGDVTLAALCAGIADAMVKEKEKRQ